MPWRVGFLRPNTTAFGVVGVLACAPTLAHAQCVLNGGDPSTLGQIEVVFHYPSQATQDAEIPPGQPRMAGPDSGDFTPEEKGQLLQAMYDYNDVLRDIGGLGLDITVREDDSTFVLGDYANTDDDVPTVHFGLFDWVCTLGDPDDCFMSAAWRICGGNTAFIGTVRPSASRPMRFDEPDRYYNHPRGRWFRGGYVHEMGHALGLAHTAKYFSTMNYNGIPWHNRPDGEKMRPLAADVRGLRERYPDPTSQHLEVSVLNYFPDFEDTADVAEPVPALVQGLCLPSLGQEWADPFEERNFNVWLPGVAGPLSDDGLPTCGKDAIPLAPTWSAGARTVCEHDRIRTVVALSNPSTTQVRVELEMWLSRDDELDMRWAPVTDLDVRSDRQILWNVAAEQSILARQMFEMPQVGIGKHHVIIRAVATDVVTGDQVEDWIPLRGVIQQGGRLMCSEITTGPMAPVMGPAQFGFH